MTLLRALGDSVAIHINQTKKEEETFESGSNAASDVPPTDPQGPLDFPAANGGLRDAGLSKSEDI